MAGIREDNLSLHLGRFRDGQLYILALECRDWGDTNSEIKGGWILPINDKRLY